LEKKFKECVKGDDIAPFDGTLLVIIHRGNGGRGGERVQPKRRIEGQQFPKLGRKYQHD
jgi:hypothetical protein